MAEREGVPVPGRLVCGGTVSNIVWQELRWTYRWLRTYIPWRIQRKGPVFTRILRRGFRVQMRKNRVFVSFLVWLKGR